jgi:amino acid adenylation domain-containing protein
MFQKIIRNLQESKNTAFVIKDIEYSYSDLHLLVKKYYAYIQDNSDQPLIGIVMNNDIDTYAMIIASFLSDCGYVILNLSHPIDRNVTIAQEAGISVVFSSRPSDGSVVPEDLRFLSPETSSKTTDHVILSEPKPESVAYVLFTSGSTGIPKGVKITKRNLNAFEKSLAATQIAVQMKDCVLQLYDLTFDASILMLVPAICAGATVYTADFSRIKIIDVARILSTYPISYLFLVPSVISMLKSYLTDIYVQTLNKLLLGGEPVTKSILGLVNTVAPNADLWNFYGPTETTVGVVITRIDQSVLEYSYNDVIPIGTPMPGVKYAILDGDQIVNEIGHKGELFIGGDQVTDGYVNDDFKNQHSFVTLNLGDHLERYYATGDIVYYNAIGGISYCYRKDFQVKIQGYRIELTEIEFHARTFTTKQVVATLKELDGNQYIFLFVEDSSGEEEAVKNYLREKLPSYMVPRSVIFVNKFPSTTSDKVDRVKLLELI